MSRHIVDVIDILLVSKVCGETNALTKGNRIWKRLREAQKIGKDEREEEKRKERRCVLKCSVVTTAPTCLPRFFSSRLYPPRLYTKGGGKGVTYSPVLCPPERTSEASERGSKKNNYIETPSSCSIRAKILSPHTNFLVQSLKWVWGSNFETPELTALQLIRPRIA